MYETALQRLQAHSNQVKIVEQNAQKHVVAFTDGTQTASLQTTPLGERLTQLVVDPAKCNVAGSEEHPERLH